ncbi:hypothetical protein SAMN05518672_101130 [Chitinophaga sp. CF118]|uniref:hypothetical protein n=1 Tax=Chitinophaga sp. CF118 TaxID=1884367 RepID=UPI0008E66816|nr:hypothetical protein [Chitinophaga sp. CF118]SFD03250.1 hypothetical protein SAMN05518672_101130 [Chitinophaga sp. CF118]
MQLTSYSGGNKAENQSSREENIVHTGSGGAFEGTERPAKEMDREESDEHLDERLESDDETRRKRPPAY